MTYNFHTHTSRCGHAYGTVRDYVEEAMEAGITEMGFSDHAPMPAMPETSWRVSLDEAAEYVKEIKALREKYKDKITLHIGFEMEYYPKHFEEMLTFARSVGAEYLILGQHFTFNEDEGSVHSYQGSADECQLVSYADALTAGMRSGVFTYVAHPDVFHFRGDETIYEREMTKVCAASLETGIPLEINFLGIRDKRHYPSEKFWRIAGRVGCPVCFGFDAHDPRAAADLASLSAAEELVKRYALRYAPPVIRSIKD